ncbi:hypothetical protein FHW69_000448 [Luteibacter sp. Sphag1AF]|uniref:hypothetical protein n=1 Tax=Luteibacter sp. Sphag1AF TaxID=2587031 RepID=UPI0016131EDF|nr:hypothetical protein [Luteibacter sp. Sphag1AF]MBB3225858.1 hypothetical protein [Luteibacter sp. Sphag1AF]
MSTKASWRRSLLNAVGGVLSVAGIVYVAFRMKGYWASVDVAALDRSLWVWCAVLVPLGVGMNALLALAWRDLLLSQGVPTRRRLALALYGRSQLAKYVPGNIFHFASRQAMGMSEGLPAAPLARSVPLELGLICFAAALCMPLIVPSLVPRIGAWLSVVGLGLTITVGVLVVRRFLSAVAGRALLLHVGYLLASGAMFVSLVRASSLPLGTDACFIVAGAYVAAWLAGLVTPGAPAGMGVRELVLIALLGALVSQPVLLLALVLTRMVGIVADGITWVIALLIRPHHPKDRDHAHSLH